jgi:hypothetical protein
MNISTNEVQSLMDEIAHLKTISADLLAAVKAADDVFMRLYSSHPVRIILHDAIAKAEWRAP